MEKVNNLLSIDEKETIVPVSDPCSVDTLFGGEEARVIDNEVLIRQAFETDPKFGCELLFRHYYQGLCSHASRFVNSKSIAEDIVSDLFYQFYLKGTFKKISSSYRLFLYKSVRNKVYNYLRLEAKRSVELDQSYENTLCTTSQQPDSVIQYEELCQQVESAINTLPSKCRKVYLMHRFEDKKYSEIAEELQLSSRTVEVHIRKANQIIRGAISRSLIFFLILMQSIHY